MAQLLLTSTGFFHQKVRNQFIKLITNKKTAVIITTASPQKESNPYAIQAKVDLTEMGFEQVSFLDVEKDSLAPLEQVDVIYLNGGNPFKLLKTLKESGADRLLQKRTTEPCILVGVSAGAVVLGASIRIVNWFSPALNTMGMKDFKGCGLYAFSLFPHADREDLFPGDTPVEARIQEFEKASGESVLRLADDDFELLTINV